MKSWLENNAREMFTTHNEGKFVVAERSIRTLKNQIYKYVTSVSKNVHIDKSGDIVNEYTNTYHSTVKMKPFDVKLNTYIVSNREINEKDCKFKIGNIVRMLKYKNIFAKVHSPNWSEEWFTIKRFINTVLWTYVVNDLNRK